MKETAHSLLLRSLKTPNPPTHTHTQSFFNNHIFQMELAEYAKEGVTGKNITYDDNQPLLDLLLTVWGV